MNFLKTALPLIVSCIVLFSCDVEPKNPVSEYGDTLINSYKKGQDAGEVANLDTVKKAVQAYRASNDRYPESLDKVQDLIASPIDLSKYDYSPETGSVSIKK